VKFHLLIAIVEVVLWEHFSVFVSNVEVASIVSSDAFLVVVVIAWPVVKVKLYREYFNFFVK